MLNINIVQGNFPGVYSSVSAHREWIDEEIENNGGGTFCATTTTSAASWSTSPLPSSPPVRAVPLTSYLSQFRAHYKTFSNYHFLSIHGLKSAFRLAFHPPLSSFVQLPVCPSDRLNDCFTPYLSLMSPLP